MTWHQPLCQACWYRDRPHDEPNPRPLTDRRVETCCKCGEETVSGIYATYNPHAVPYPTDVAPSNQNGET
jgi:hypothetical protein